MPLMTGRLILRPWTDQDREPFALMAADPQVMRHLRPLSTTDALDRWVDYQIKHEIDHGYCLWAVQIRSTPVFIDAVGLLNVRFQAHFTPAIEVSWRLARPFWEQGYAPEAARAALAFVFQHPNAQEVVAHTGWHDHQSRRVMEKLGMSHNAGDDFDHPLLSPDDPLSHQVLYRARSANCPDISFP